MTEKKKGLFHLFLAVTACFEFMSSRSRKRSILLGAMCGWHLALAAEHFTDTEGDANSQLDRTRRSGF